MKFDPRKQTIRDYVSDNILNEFLKQLPWEKDQLFTSSFSDGEYRDIVKLDEISDATIKIKKGTMSGRFFVEILKQLPKFDYDGHHYMLWFNTFTRATIPPKKHKDRWKGFHVRKILAQVKEAV